MRKEQVFQAIRNYFGDTSLSVEDTEQGLEEIIEFIEGLLESLDC